MNSQETIMNELYSISPGVAAIPRVNVFTVPDGYFNQLDSSILDVIRQEAFFSHIQPLAIGEVPAGYFEGLAGQIMSRIKEESNADETSSISPVVADIGRKNVFTVPEGYFESISDVINIRIPRPAKVISFKRSSFYKYAVAAVITGFLGLSVFSVFDKKNSGTVIENKAVMAKAGEIIKSKSFDAELQTVSDSEIEQYLVESGEDVNAALVASVIDETNLPATDEYLTDDNTLDEFLDKMNLNN